MWGRQSVDDRFIDLFERFVVAVEKIAGTEKNPPRPLVAVDKRSKKAPPQPFYADDEVAAMYEEAREIVRQSVGDIEHDRMEELVQEEFKELWENRNRPY